MCTTQQQKTNNSILKCAKNVNQHFPKGDIQIANEHTNIRQSSLLPKEMQVKPTVRYCPTPPATAIIRDSGRWGGCGGSERSHAARET